MQLEPANGGNQNYLHDYAPLELNERICIKIDILRPHLFVVSIIEVIVS